jgi:UDP-glucose 6-dehydrogenase
MKVSIIGQGYVGLTISVFAGEHHNVIGFDKNQGVVDAQRHIRQILRDLKWLLLQCLRH